MRNVRRCWHFCVFEIFCEVLLSWWKIFELLPAASLRYFDGGSSLLRKCAGFSSTIPLTIIFHSKKCCDPFISYRENLLHISVQCQTDDFILGSLSSGPTVICFLIHPDRCPVFCLSVTRFPFLWVRPVILIVAENPAGINFACNSRLFVHGAQRGGKHAMEHFWWKFQSNFEIVLNGIQREGSQRPDVEARRKFSCRAASTSPGRQSCLCSDDSHSAETRTRARDTHEVWSNTWVECELDLSTCSSQFHLSTDDSHQPHRHVRNHAEIVTLGLDRVRTKHLLHVELEYAHTCSLCKLHIAPRLLGSVCLCLTNCARSWRRLGRNPPKATTSSRTTVLTSTTQQTKIPKGMICTNMIKFLQFAQRMCEFLAFRFAFGKEAALSGNFCTSGTILYSVFFAHFFLMVLLSHQRSHHNQISRVSRGVVTLSFFVRRARFLSNVAGPLLSVLQSLSCQSSVTVIVMSVICFVASFFTSNGAMPWGAQQSSLEYVMPKRPSLEPQLHHSRKWHSQLIWFQDNDLILW